MYVCRYAVVYYHYLTKKTAELTDEGFNSLQKNEALSVEEGK